MGIVSKIFGASMAAFTTSLAYFQYECNKEKSEWEQSNISKFNETFDPNQTEAKAVALPFADKGVKNTIYYGKSYIFNQWAPCALMKLCQTVLPNFNHKLSTDQSMEKIAIHDARKEKPGSFHETGFTLVELDEEPKITDWRTSHYRVIRFKNIRQVISFQSYTLTVRSTSASESDLPFSKFLDLGKCSR